jgi:replication factor C large subunit
VITVLSEIVRPRKISALVGNEQTRLELVKWLRSWKIGSKPVLLQGPPGVGKSTSVYAVAAEFGYDVLEYNASDVRTRKKLSEMLAPMLENRSIFGDADKFLVFLDEIDGLSGRQDYAGMDYILEFIAEASVPVAMASNSEDDPKLKKIQQKSKVLHFKPVNEDLIFMYLKSISRRDGRQFPDELFRRISSASKGDVRFALNLLQTVSSESSALTYSDKQFYSNDSALEAIFSSDSLDEALPKMRDFDAAPLDKIRAVYASVISSKTLTDDEKASSLKLISLADILLRRINKTQNWRLLRYFDKYLLLASVGKGLKPSDSAIPWNLRLAIWNDGRVVKEFLHDLSPVMHVGKATFASYYLPYLSYYLKHKPKELELFLRSQNYDESEKRVMLKIAPKV